MKAGGQVGWINGPVPVIDPDDMTGLLAASSDLAFVVSAEGEILSILVAKMAADMPQLDHWSGHPMQEFLTSESIPKFENALAAIGEAGALHRAVELNHTDGSDWQYPVRYSFHAVGPGNSVLMLGQDLRLVAETQLQLVQAQIALERGYEERREYDARYRMIMANTREAFLFVSASDGRIRDANPAAASLLGATRDELISNSIAQEFKHRRKGEFLDALTGLAGSDFEQNITAQGARNDRDVTITPTVFRAAGERLIVCRLAPESEVNLASDRLQEDMTALFHKSTDAIVLCDTRGVITDVNEAFLKITDLNSLSEVKWRSLADFLQRGQIDLNVMLENATRSGHMRVYATKMSNEIGIQASVEISVVYLNDRDKPAVGFIIRDADRVEAFRSATKATNQPETPNHNVVELVGSAPLKEIVAETSDVIERMCIETAVELTRNNRAAAAEMLGLSRQSLYVKLRKYGLLKRDE
jgi:transcriptional regulator PpsR